MLTELAKDDIRRGDPKRTGGACQQDHHVEQEVTDLDTDKVEKIKGDSEIEVIRQRANNDSKDIEIKQPYKGDRVKVTLLVEEGVKQLTKPATGGENGTEGLALKLPHGFGLFAVLVYVWGKNALLGDQPQDQDDGYQEHEDDREIIDELCDRSHIRREALAVENHRPHSFKASEDLVEVIGEIIEDVDLGELCDRWHDGILKAEQATEVICYRCAKIPKGVQRAGD